MKMTITITKWPVTVEIVDEDLQGDLFENLERIIDVMESREEFLFATYFEEEDEEEYEGEGVYEESREDGEKENGDEDSYLDEI